METAEQGSSLSVETIDFPELDLLWNQYRHIWNWDNPFVTPPWLKSWWRVFGETSELLLLLIACGGRPIGVAPLMLAGDTGRIIGSADLCDTGDVIVEAQEEQPFFSGLFKFLESRRISRLVFGSVRPDSAVRRFAAAAHQPSSWRSSSRVVGYSIEMALPVGWPEYFAGLSSKQRHEVRRKLRRLSEAGEIVVGDCDAGEMESAMNRFIDLFRRSRKDKAAFMNDARERFFRELAVELAASGMLRLQEMTINGVTAAMVFCVQHEQSLYLYNNAYRPEYRSLSIGLMSKVLSIQTAIEAELAIYDFLGGTERYKHQLGGREVRLYSCTFTYTR
jgi:CelD/BcsL family acetyltransferase involved in cellulose biosynthesis